MPVLNRRAFLGTGMAVALLASLPARAAVVEARQLLALTRALAYDRALVERSGDDLRITALYVAGDNLSEEMAADVVGVFQALRVQGITIQQLPIKVNKVAFDAASLVSVAQSADALFLCSGLEGELDALLAVTREQKVVSMTVSKDSVSKGVALGVTDEDGKLRIFVNLPGAKAEGASFSSNLLQIAKVFR